MREVRQVQRFGRHLLYVVLALLVMAAFPDVGDTMWGVLLLAVFIGIGVSQYRAWTVHDRVHRDWPEPGCRHCRWRAGEQRDQALRDVEQAEMERLHRQSEQP